MFEKFAKSPARKVVSKVELTVTSQFVQALAREGLRISYGALTEVARSLREDSSRSIPAQRGAKLVKSLPVELQPYVCRRSGGYHASVEEIWGEAAPEGLLKMGVITSEQVGEALEIFLASLGE